MRRVPILTILACSALAPGLHAAPALSTPYVFPDGGGPRYPEGAVMLNNVKPGNIFGATPYGDFVLKHSGKTWEAKFGGPFVSGGSWLPYGKSFYAPTEGSDCGAGGGCGSVVAITAALKSTTIANFSGGADGANPGPGMVGFNGAIIGATTAGGSANAPDGYGTLFSLAPIGSKAPHEQTLHTFTGGSDGGWPDGHLLAYNGSIYGVTAAGGAYNYGTVFQLSPPVGSQTQWQFNTLYSFTGNADGGTPAFGVVASGGSLYGVATQGGYVYLGNNQYGFCTYWEALHGCGVIYQLSPPSGGNSAWVETPIYAPNLSFDASTVGPLSGGLIADANGILYGPMGNTVKYNGGPSGYGSLYQLVPSTINGVTSWAFTSLYEFSGGADGWYPNGSLVVDSSGALYGAARNGGAVSGQYNDPCNNVGCGTVFKLSGTGFKP